MCKIRLVLNQNGNLNLEISHVRGYPKLRIHQFFLLLVLLSTSSVYRGKETLEEEGEEKQNHWDAAEKEGKWKALGSRAGMHPKDLGISEIQVGSWPRRWR